MYVVCVYVGKPFCESWARVQGPRSYKEKGPVSSLVYKLVAFFLAKFGWLKQFTFSFFPTKETRSPSPLSGDQGVSLAHIHPAYMISENDWGRRKEYTT